MFFASLLLAAAPASASVCANPLPHTFKDHPAECRGGSAPNAGRFRPLSAAGRAKMLRAFNRLLRDGPSTRWQIEGSNGGTVCGYLNSKNSFGAYSGWMPFIYSTEEDDASTYEGREWFFETLCHNIRVPPA